jgi:hypothetical protein
MTSVLDQATVDLTVIPPGAEVPEGHGILLILDRTGHTTLTWNPEAPEEVAAARSHFAALRGTGYLATRQTGPHTGETLHEFDPTAAEITMQPATVGG